MKMKNKNNDLIDGKELMLHIYKYYVNILKWKGLSGDLLSYQKGACDAFGRILFDLSLQMKTGDSNLHWDDESVKILEKIKNSTYNFYSDTKERKKSDDNT